MFNIIPGSLAPRIADPASRVADNHADALRIAAPDEVLDLSDSAVGFDARFDDTSFMRLNEIRSQIERGTYLTPHKLNVVAGMIQADLLGH